MLFMIIINQLVILWFYPNKWGFPGGLVVKNLLANAGDVRDNG